ncbi:uncharacterized protein LOC111068833 [Drosophila obscura]|uniref:uncharacterized protein LOC111068833 n=1 Tax=Drosophila obscura TaxID=7282 RepID=UPI001BB2BA86|nr:uncharacterized protein LOC111068833 [Drosophila obscura]
MFKFLFIFLLSILAFKLIRANRDPHLCTVPVEVTYTEEVDTPLSEFGKFEEAYRKLGINGGRKNVNKTKTEMREVCCPGYIMFPNGNGDCERLLTTKPTTTSSADTDETETSTDSTSWSPAWDDEYSTEQHSSTTAEENPKAKLVKFDYLKYATYACGCLIILLVIFFVCRKRTQKKYCVEHEHNHVKYDA